MGDVRLDPAGLREAAIAMNDVLSDGTWDWGRIGDDERAHCSKSAASVVSAYLEVVPGDRAAEQGRLVKVQAAIRDAQACLLADWDAGVGDSLNLALELLAPLLDAESGRTEP